MDLRVFYYDATMSNIWTLWALILMKSRKTLAFFSEVLNFKAATGHAKRKQKRPIIIVKQRKNAFKTAFDL